MTLMIMTMMGEASCLGFQGLVVFRSFQLRGRQGLQLERFIDAFGGEVCCCFLNLDNQGNRLGI